MKREQEKGKPIVNGVTTCQERLRRAEGSRFVQGVWILPEKLAWGLFASSDIIFPPAVQ